MRRAVAVPAALGLLALAFGVAYSSPADRQAQQPFAVTGEVGDQIASQHLIATVHEVGLADVVELGSWRGTTAGVWLVVDATLQARSERSTVNAEVFIDGVLYPSTSRTSTDTVDGRVADAGFPVSGTILVELPADVQSLPGARSATLQLSTGGDVRLDSVIELNLDLTAYRVEHRVEREPARDGDR